MDRILAGSAGTIDLLNYDASGALADAGGGNGSAAVTDSAGVAIAGSPFTATRVSVGLYRIQMAPGLTTLDTYDVAWTMPDTTTRASRFEVVGSFLFTIAALRAFDAELANATTYPAAAIRDVRETVEQRFARACGVSFTLRGRREVLDGTGTTSLWLGERLVNRAVACAIDGASVDVSGFAVYERGQVVSSGGFSAGTRNVSILYEHGHNPPPLPIVDAGLRYARELIVKGAFDDLARATGIQTDVGFMRITQAGKEHPTGIPDIDVVLAAYNRRMPLIA